MTHVNPIVNVKPPAAYKPGWRAGQTRYYWIPMRQGLSSDKLYNSLVKTFKQTDSSETFKKYSMNNLNFVPKFELLHSITSERPNTRSVCEYSLPSPEYYKNWRPKPTPYFNVGVKLNILDTMPIENKKKVERVLFTLWLRQVRALSLKVAPHRADYYNWFAKPYNRSMDDY
ncbi:MAG: hypothetical protein VKJ06_05690 [Vampirovibrionales bacterium]|nr:hypothetical protein [Vampirovibrionales bacterium]